jgi:hypothetical protein
VWWAAKAAQNAAKQNLADGLIRAKDVETSPALAQQLQTLLDRVNQLKEGAFSPLPQQPLVKALLFPASSAGRVALIESGLLPGV